MKIYDARFKYTPSLSTNIVSTWKRFGFKRTTEAERMARQRRLHGAEAQISGASVTPLDPAKRKPRALCLDRKTVRG